MPTIEAKLSASVATVATKKKIGRSQDYQKNTGH
jgi:hypothetical protein